MKSSTGRIWQTGPELDIRDPISQAPDANLFGFTKFIVQF